MDLGYPSSRIWSGLAVSNYNQKLRKLESLTRLFPAKPDRLNGADLCCCRILANKRFPFIAAIAAATATVTNGALPTALAMPSMFLAEFPPRALTQPVSKLASQFPMSFGDKWRGLLCGLWRRRRREKNVAAVTDALITLLLCNSLSLSR